MKQRIFTLRQIIEEGTARLMEAGIEEAALDAWYLLEYTAGISRAVYYGDPNRKLEEPLVQKYLEYIEIRGKRIPLQHITGEQEFMSYPFYVNEYVLIPRQDTETLVEEAVSVVRDKVKSAKAEDGAGEAAREVREKRLKTDETVPDGDRIRVLDMCTGSGCILLSLMKICPEVDGTGCDISEEALKIAGKNAKRLQVDARWVQSDLFEGIDTSYDMILSNPPYIRTSDIETLQDEVRFYDPRIALDGGEDGLYFYRRIIEDSISYIKDGGSLMFEIGCDQGKDVAELMKSHGYENIMIKKDLSGLDRVAVGVYNRRCVCGSGFL